MTKKNLAEVVTSENETTEVVSQNIAVETKAAEVKYKYKVAEFLINGLDFPDLPMAASNGVGRPLHLSPGQFIPTDLLNERDVKLSEFGGCISRCLENGWLVDITAPIKEVVQEETPSSSTPTSAKNGYTLVETLTPEAFAKMRDDTATVSVMKTDGPQTAVTVENIKFNGSVPVTKAVFDTKGDDVAVGSARSGDATVLTPEKRLQMEKKEEAAQIRSYQDFEKLTHFAKLDVIAHTLDVKLLKMVAANTPVKQLHNNANGRLRDMGQAPVASKTEIL